MDEEDSTEMDREVEELFNKIIPDDMKQQFWEARLRAKVKQLEHAKNWRDKNKLKIKAYQKEYVKLNIDKVREYRKRWYDKQKSDPVFLEKRRKYQRNWCYRKKQLDKLSLD